MENEEVSPPPTVPRCFRLRRYYLFLGLGCGVFFAVMGIGSTLAALWNVDGSFARPLLAAWIFGSFWSCFIWLAVWITAAYFRERLLISESAIVQHGVFRSRQIDFTDVVNVNWRRRPVGGSVVIRTDAVKITIELENFSRDEREELISTLRGQFTTEIQHDWSLFEAAFLERGGMFGKG